MLTIVKKNCLKGFKVLTDVLTVFTFLAILYSCSTKKLDSVWQSESVSIDGMADDWDPASLVFEEKLKMVYGLGNDDDNLRFVIRFKDRRLANRIDSQGMYIWLNKEKRKGIRYIDESARDRMIEKIMSGPGSMRRNGLNELPTMLSGKFFWMENGIDTEIEFADAEKYRAVASFVDGNYCLEYEISHDLLENQNKFTAGIEISGIDEDLKKLIEGRKDNIKGMEGRGDGPGGMGGRGRGMGGGMRGGRGGKGGRGMEDRQMDFEAQEIWVNVQLATPKN